MDMERYRYELYTERACETYCVSCCGAFAVLVVGLCVFTYAIDAAHVGDDGPSFSQTLLWRSLAFHTDAYADYLTRSTPSPAPPRFL